MKKKIVFFLLFLLGSFGSVEAQLSLEVCKEKARTHHPAQAQASLIEQSAGYDVANAQRGYLPQLSISAKATYQSEVTELPIKVPGVTVEGLSKDQYQALAELSQVLYDGGLIGSQKALSKASAWADATKLEVDLYAINEQINQLYFGILLLQEQILQNDLLQKELNINYKRLETLLNNGVANQSDVDAIRVELLNAKQRRTEILSTAKAYKMMLSVWIGEPVADDVLLQRPIMAQAESTNNRPELRFFGAQDSLLLQQKTAVSASNLPKLAAFIQGGIGKPGLNMLKNEFSPFYIAGVRFSWNLGGLYTWKNKLAKIEVGRSMVASQKQVFLFQNQIQATQQTAEIDKMKQLLADDAEIIALRTAIKKSAEAKVANGTLSVSDLIREINAENMAEQQKSFHEIQLVLAEYKLKNILNN
jgi:outer membrane protein TolC